MRRPNPDTCRRCPLGGEGPCRDCVDTLGPEPLVWHPSGVDGIRVLGRYERAAGRLVRGLKFANRRTPVAALAVALADIGPDPAPTVVTWVPSTVRRRSRRGVEHTALLARAVPIWESEHAAIDSEIRSVEGEALRAGLAELV